MIKRIFAVAALTLASMQGAQAQTCATNFETEGVPLVTAVNYKSWQNFSGVDAKTALDRAHRAVLVEGFMNVKVDKSVGAITTVQETSGSGRPQTLRVVVRKQGKGVRVDARFMVQMGQVAPEATTRDALCRIIEAASG